MLQVSQMTAMHWLKGHQPLAVQPIDLKKLLDTRGKVAVANFQRLAQQVLSEPEFIFKGLRDGIPLNDRGDGLECGYCYCSRMKHRYELQGGDPAIVTSSWDETYLVFLNDKFRAIGAYFDKCDALGRPDDADGRFDQELWSQP